MFDNASHCSRNLSHRQIIPINQWLTTTQVGLGLDIAMVDNDAGRARARHSNGWPRIKWANVQGSSPSAAPSSRMVTTSCIIQEVKHDAV